MRGSRESDGKLGARIIVNEVGTIQRDRLDGQYFEIDDPEGNEIVQER